LLGNSLRVSELLGNSLRVSELLGNPFFVFGNPKWISRSVSGIFLGFRTPGNLFGWVF
jgi:hypothetical protein